MKSHSGFTLIELSIVLVIIGLIIGGVLAGKSLIHAAEIRKTVQQVEQFDAAINTFRNKYNCLPGDCTNPSAFGFTNFIGNINTGVHSGVVSVGNGDGMISDDGSGGSEIESAFLWLQQAGLIEGVNISYMSNPSHGFYTIIPAAIQSFQSFSANGWSLTYATWNVLYVDLANDITPGNEFFPQSGHYYLLSSDAEMSLIPTLTAIIPADAFAIDSKMDDGLPRSGRVLASGNDYGDLGPNGNAVPLPISDPNSACCGDTGFDEGAAGANSPYCVTSATPPVYNVQNTNSENDTAGTAVGPYCVMAVKASF